MIWMLLNDAVDFCRRHLLFLVILLLPVQLLLIFLLYFSGMELFESVAQLTPSQVGIEDKLMASFEPSISLMLYLIGSVYPTALVISYVHQIFAAQESGALQVHSIALPLWFKMLGLCCMTWGSLFIVCVMLVSVLMSFGLGSSVVFFLLMFVFLGGCVYVYYRLSLAAYFCAQGRVSLLHALRLSWQYAHSVVFMLMFGHFLVSVIVFVFLSSMTYLIQSILPESMHQIVEICMSLVGSFAAVVQAVFGYRVFAFVTEKGERYEN